MKKKHIDILYKNMCMSAFVPGGPPKCIALTKEQLKALLKDKRQYVRKQGDRYVGFMRKGDQALILPIEITGDYEYEYGSTRYTR